MPVRDHDQWDKLAPIDVARAYQEQAGETTTPDEAEVEWP